MFRILLVDDDPVAAYLTRKVMENLQGPHELHSVIDGVEALDFLHRRGVHESARLPNLILLDVHMPRLNGLQTLAAIKNDSELCVIPVIMLSAGGSPEDVRRSYAAHANCYVQKPMDLERCVKFIQAIEAFWMDFALLASSEEETREHLQVKDSKRKTSTAGIGGDRSGPAIAQGSGEARSRAMSTDATSGREPAPRVRSSGCEEHNRLLDAFGAAVHELLQLHKQQFLAVVERDTECNRFDLLIHVANEQKQLAKYAYLRHVESHGCSNTDALNQTRT
jgi:two-component system response regulator